MRISNVAQHLHNKKTWFSTACVPVVSLIFLLLLLNTAHVLAQNGSVSGTIRDQENKPVEGATITVQESKASTVADKSGMFSIRAVKGNTLIISSVNFETLRVLIRAEENIDIRLDSKSGSLSDVVVIGYGVAKKKDVTGAVTSVNLNKVAEIPLTSVDQALTGRAGGVQINQSNGQAGAGTSIRIRGGNSLNGTNEPLFVIDGFPIINDNGAYSAGGPLGLTNGGSGNGGQGNPNGALNWLNPADIQSIEVLKDASATAIYGSRGANGVIIITTKKGKSGQPRLNFSANYGVSQLNDGNISLMNAREFATYQNLYNLEQGKTVFYKDTTIAGKLYPSPSKLGEGTNWIDAIKRNGVSQNYSMDFSGGKEVIYSGSIGWLNQETPLIGSQFNRANFRLNLQTNLTPWLSLDNTTNYSQSKADNSPSDIRDVQKYGLFEAALFSNPVEPVYNSDGSLNYTGSGADIIRPDIGFSPIALATDVLNRNTIQTFIDNISLKAKILPGLSFEARGSIFKNDVLRDLYYNSKTTFNGSQVGGLAGKNTNSSSSYLLETFGNYNKNFGKNQLNAVVGYSHQKTEYRNLNTGASNFPNDNLKNENLGAGTAYPTQSSRVEDLLTSYFVRLNNVYNDKYIATFTARYDGSSKFAKGNQWSFFPSGALSWRISEERFLKQVKAISDLKLRLSYGLSGNQAISSLQTKSTLGFNQYPYGGVLQTGIFPAVLGNTNLTWETTKQFNLGIDFGFWNQKLAGSINYYVKNTDDLLQYLSLPANSGYGGQLANVGSISNKGIELELRGNIISKGDFKWDVNANIASNKQRLTNLGRGDLDTLFVSFNVVGGSSANIALIKNQPVGLFYGYVSDGIFRTAAELTSGPAVSGSKVGTRRFKDLNKDGKISDQDRSVIGDPNPDFTFGISNNFSYKGFDLNFLVQGAIGGDMWNLGDYVQTRLGNRSTAALDYFTPANTNAKYPAPGQNVGYDNHSDFTVESASFVRLKSINLGYNVPVSKIKFMRSIRIYASATNLLTFTNYSGFDPEVNSFAQSNLFRNIDILSIPLYKTYTLGVNVGF
jgi:TonB-dependent starch-binding outer membrane protein SusC